MSTATTAAPFVFNGDYDDLDQVAHLWDAYAAEHHAIRRMGRYPYDDSFKGRIDGLVADDKHEDTAIYLLQVTRHIHEHETEIQALRDQGFVEPTIEPEGRHTHRYRRIAIIGYQYHQGRDGTITITENSRLVTQNGQAALVLPKGARNRGYTARDRLILVKD